MKYLSKEDFETAIPNNFIVDCDDYLNLISVYYGLLNKYIFDIGLSKYEDELRLKNYPITDDVDIYQELSLMKYLYIRSNLHIENLSDVEKNFLRQKSDFIIDKDTETFINSTLKKVLSNGQNFDVFYGPLSSHYMVQYGALVIGLRYDEDYYTDTFNVDSLDYLKRLDEQQKYIAELKDKIENELTSRLGIDVKVIEYNSNTVNPIKKSRIH